MANLNSSKKSSWAPLAIGALVVLIILGIIYYFYYYRVDKTCVKSYVKTNMPGANEDTINGVTEWMIANTVIKRDKTGECKDGYVSLYWEGGSECNICEIKPQPKMPIELENKVNEWRSSPEGAAFIKASLSAKSGTPTSV